MKKATTSILLTLAACLSVQAAPNKGAPQKTQSPGDIIAMFDTNGDGLLSEAELSSMMEARRKQMQGRPGADDRAKKMRDAKAAWSVGEAAIKAAKKAMVENFDRNGDGILDKTEQATMEQGAKDAMEWGKKMVTRQFDADGNGELNGAERGKAMEAVKKMVVGDIIKTGSKDCKDCSKKECSKSKCGKKDCNKGECSKKDCDKAKCCKKDCDKGNCCKKECAKGECSKKDGDKAKCCKKDGDKGECCKKDCDKGECSKKDGDKAKCCKKDGAKGECCKKDSPKKDGHHKAHGASEGHKHHGSNAPMPSRERIMKRFDTNQDGKLSDTEKEALKAEMKKRMESRKKETTTPDRRRGPSSDRRAEMMKKYDSDKDGKLSDTEKEALKADMKKRWESRKKDGAKAEPKAKTSPQVENNSDRPAKTARPLEADLEANLRELSATASQMMLQFDADGSGDLDNSEKEALKEAMITRFKQMQEARNNLN